MPTPKVPFQTRSVISVYLPTPVALELERLALKRGVSRSAMAKELLMEALKTKAAGRVVTVTAHDQQGG